MTDQVKKIPMISPRLNKVLILQTTTQLYVTPTFAYLNLVLEEFANKMALRTGGLSGIEKLINSAALIELSTGLQISGVLLM
jgi:phenylalanine-4-hydroxylase